MRTKNRFIIGLQDKKDQTCFKDVDEADTRADAIKKAQKEATEAGRPACVFEHGNAEGIVYRTDREEREKEKKQRPEPFKSMRNRRK